MSGRPRLNSPGTVDQPEQFEIGTPTMPANVSWPPHCLPNRQPLCVSTWKLPSACSAGASYARFAPVPELFISAFTTKPLFVLAVIDWDTVSTHTPGGRVNGLLKILTGASRAGQPSFIHRMQRTGTHCSAAVTVSTNVRGPQ
jgi:hypothetical protein